MNLSDYTSKKFYYRYEILASEFNERLFQLKQIYLNVIRKKSVEDVYSIGTNTLKVCKNVPL